MMMGQRRKVVFTTRIVEKYIVKFMDHKNLKKATLSFMWWSLF
jgi:hypothetical protein